MNKIHAVMNDNFIMPLILYLTQLLPNFTTQMKTNVMVL